MLILILFSFSFSVGIYYAGQCALRFAGLSRWCFVGCFSGFVGSFSRRFSSGFSFSWAGCFCCFGWLGGCRLGSFARQALGFALTATHFAGIVRRATCSARYDACDLCGRFADGFAHCDFCCSRLAGNDVDRHFGGLFAWRGSGGFCADLRDCFDDRWRTDFCSLYRCFFSRFSSACFIGLLGHWQLWLCSLLSRSCLSHLLGRDGLGADQFCACFSGNGCGYDQWRRGFSLGFAAFFSAFDHIAAGVALTLAAIAATTLATRAAARTFTFYAFRFIVWLSIFVAQYFIVDNGSCFGAWLALFTWCARLARFTLRALGTHFCSAALAAAVSALRCVQRLAQFAGWALFAWLFFFAGLFSPPPRGGAGGGFVGSPP